MNMSNFYSSQITSHFGEWINNYVNTKKRTCKCTNWVWCLETLQTSPGIGFTGKDQEETTKTIHWWNANDIHWKTSKFIASYTCQSQPFLIFPDPTIKFPILGPFPENCLYGVSWGCCLYYTHNCEGHSNTEWKQRPHERQGGHTLVKSKQAVKQLSGRELEGERKKPRVRMVYVPLKPSMNNWKLVVAL